MEFRSASNGFTLQNGVSSPCIAYGTWRMFNGPETYDAVRKAISLGYRHIDTANRYNNEISVGQAIRECGVPRKEIFVSSKLQNPYHGYDYCMQSFELSLQLLGLSYIDQFLIHYPIPKGHNDDFAQMNLSTWRALEKLYDEGLVRSIGLSNFRVHHIEPLLAKANVKPCVNQIEYHPGYMQRDVVEYCKAQGIQIEAWSPFGGQSPKGSIFQIPLLMEIAGKYGKSVAQLVLRWILQRGILPIPKAADPQRAAQNLDIFNFIIQDTDMAKIDSLTVEECGWSGYDPDNLSFWF